MFRRFTQKTHRSVAESGVQSTRVMAVWASRSAGDIWELHITNIQVNRLGPIYARTNYLDHQDRVGCPVFDVGHARGSVTIENRSRPPDHHVVRFGRAQASPVGGHDGQGYAGMTVLVTATFPGL